MTAPLPSSDILTNTKIWFTRARPEPTESDIHSQIGCHFEEISEMCQEITARDPVTEDMINDVRVATHRLAEHLKGNHDVITIMSHQRTKFLDAICDQIVTGVGAAHVLGMDPLNGLTEVNRSNYSKFDDAGLPIRNPETQKVLKGPNYSEANLAPYV